MFAAAPGFPFPFRTTRETSFGLGAAFFALLPLAWKRLLGRLLGRLDVGVHELLHRLVDVRRIGRELVRYRRGRRSSPGRSCPDGQLVGEARV